MSDVLRVGVAGLGTVGGGVVRLLNEHGGLHARRAIRPVRIVAVSALEMPPSLVPLLQGVRWHDDVLGLVRSADVDVVVELIGGAEGIAKDVVETALNGGKSVVTANKALIARHGNILARAAEARGAALLFEAAVAGGVPILQSLRKGLAANRFGRVYGVLNGTCNYILTEMEESGREFGEVLGEAQALGYAEADPDIDIDGHDTAHKLAILASVAFGCPVDLDSVFVEGIRQITATDIDYARRLGYRIRLLGLTRRTAVGIERRVHPCMVPTQSAIADVRGVLNAVVVEGDFVGQTVFEGAGAGERPTASAVVGDLIDLARGHVTPPFAVPVHALASIPAMPMSERRGAYYIRMVVNDRPGVLADVTRVLAEQEVSIETILQSARSPGSAVPLVLTTHSTSEAAMTRVGTRLRTVPAVAEGPVVTRIERL